MNNEGTRKEEVARTYQGVDGYAPSASYLGTNGYCLELALRPGGQHSAMETEHNLERVLPMAAKLTAKLAKRSILFRADSGLCSAKIRRAIDAQAKALAREIAYIIKWNPRSAPVQTLARERVAQESTVWCFPARGQAQLCVAGYGVRKRLRCRPAEHKLEGIPDTLESWLTDSGDWYASHPQLFH